MATPTSQISVCPNCAGRLPAAAATSCPFCRGKIDAPSSSQTPLTRSVHDAADVWARSVFGAPKEISEFITAIEVRDEVLERVVTEIVRRDIREERLPSSHQYATSPRLDPVRVDPFAISVTDLRAASEYITPCGYCRGSGTCACNGCGGSGQAACGNCNGSGKEVKYYKTTSRLINCKVCRARGTVTCAGCYGNGEITCSLCMGSGHQIAWLTYDQRSRWAVLMEPQSPVIKAHPQLSEPRYLVPVDLGAFRVLIQEQADGPVMIDGYRSQPGPILRASIAGLDPRHERVNRQQYTMLAVVRRDATYGMAGVASTLVLSGSDLLGSSTPTALRGINRRLYYWAASGIGLVVVTGVALASFHGSSVYFATSNVLLLIIWALAMLLAVPFLGAVFRSLQPGFGFQQLRSLEKYLGIGASVALVAFIAIGFIAQPRISEVNTALTRGDSAHARLVVEALKESNGSAQAVLDVEDAVMIAEAKPLVGDARLKILDEVVTRKGARATEAAALARTDRLTEIRRLVEGKSPERAIAAIDRWFPETWKADADISEERARANDVANTQCVDGPCRVLAANNAVAASSSKERIDQAASAKTKLLADLVPTEVPSEDLLTRLKRIRTIGATAKKASEVAPKDEQIAEASKTASTWASAERGKIPLVGADQPIVEELLGATVSVDGKATSVVVDGTRVFLSLDQLKKCRGLYMVGEKEGARAIKGAAWSGDRLLSQAVGHPASLKRPAENTGAARWFETIAPIVARWKNGELVELRVGDATP